MWEWSRHLSINDTQKKRGKTIEREIAHIRYEKISSHIYEYMIQIKQFVTDILKSWMKSKGWKLNGDLRDEKYINWELHSGHNFLWMEKKINCGTINRDEKFF
jgi:hypothetical protein